VAKGSANGKKKRSIAHNQKGNSNRALPSKALATGGLSIYAGS
jgi:hypothetical protein